MELGGAGRGHGGSGTNKLQAGPGAGTGQGEGRAGQACRKPCPAGELVQDRGMPARPGQPQPEPATLGGGQRGGCVPRICHSGKGQRACSQPWPPEEWASRGAVGITEDGAPPGPEARSRGGASLAVAAGS